MKDKVLNEDMDNKGHIAFLSIHSFIYSHYFYFSFHLGCTLAWGLGGGGGGGGFLLFTQ